MIVVLQIRRVSPVGAAFMHRKLGLVDGMGIDTGFFHTDYIVLIDKYRNIRGYYHGLDTFAVSKLSNDIVLLALEKDPHRKKFYDGKLELLAIVFFITIIGIAALLFFLKKDKKHHVINDN